MANLIAGAGELAYGTAGSRHALHGEARVPDVDAFFEHVRRRSGALQFATMQLLTHRRLLLVLPDYLVGVYHSMRTAAAVMEAAHARSVRLSTSCPVAARLVPYWTDHLREEEGHDGWLLADLGHLDIDVQRALEIPPSTEVAELMGTLHFWILHTHPVAALAYFHIVESGRPSEKLLDWLVENQAVPRAALRTFYRHASIDVCHARDLKQLFRELPLELSHLRLLWLSAETVLSQLERIVRRSIERADGLVAQDPGRCPGG